MLLLNLPEYIIESERFPACDTKCSIASLFDVSMGLIEDRYHHGTKTNPDEWVDFLRIGSFKLNDEVKNAWNLSDYERRNIVDVVEIKKQKEKKLSAIADDKEGKVEKSFIHEKKILTKDDYLFSIRGIPKGYSMQRSIEHKNMRLVASHHFIQVRPLPGVDLHIPFIHLLFDLIVEFKLNTKFNVKNVASHEGTKYGVFNSFKIAEIREMEIHIPGNKQEQLMAYDLFIENYNKYMEASLNFNKFKNKITDKLIILKSN